MGIAWDCEDPDLAQVGCGMPDKRPRHPRTEPTEDPRVARSTRALGAALVALLAEQDFDSITVQQVLTRAGVGRATFYAHYRSKVDVLHSSYENALFWFEERLQADPGDRRLFAVSEFLEHMADQSRLLASLRQSDQMIPMRELFVAHAARIIEGRMAGPADEATRRLLARMLAGALAEAVDWWEAHRNGASPQQVDRAFHALAARVMRTGEG